MADVAALAGVSQPTVSRAINGDLRVADDTRATIMAAAERLGYVVNRAARTLAGSSTNSIGFVIAERDAHVWGNPYIPRILSGIGAELNEHDQQLVLFVAQEPQDQERLIHYVSQGQVVDGFLMITDNQDDPFLRFLLEAEIPVVVGGRPLGLDGASYVDVDNLGGARAATHHLLDVGCRHVAIITGPQTTGAGLDRLTGYREVLAERGAGAPEMSYCASDWGLEEGFRGMQALLGSHPEIDGVLAAGELLAFGALSAIRGAGLAVPEDLKLVGFDDSPAFARTDPPLSCVAQPVEELGRQMARLLLDQISSEGTDRRVMLPVQLNVRDSTATAAGQP